VLLPSIVWCIPHLRVNCADRNSSRTGTITHNSNHGNFSSNSHNSSNNNYSTMLLPHLHNRLHSGHHNRLPTAAFRASIVESWDILLVSASCQSEAIHLELRQPWSINRGANRRALRHGLAAPTIPPWRKFPWKK
jgi:hypothetical protein